MKLLRLILVLLVIPFAARADGYPNRRITFVLPYPPGGPTDVQARLIAEHLSTRLKTTVIVDNRVGGGGNTGSDYVARSAPDGYTLLFGAIPLAINMTLYKKMPFDTVRDLKPVALFATAPLVLLARPDLPATTVKEFVELAKEKRMVYSSQGIGSGPQLDTEVLAKTAGVKLTHVPYRGSQAAATDMMSSRIDVGFDSVVFGQPLVTDGRLKALAVTGLARSPLLPNVPTMAEAGFPEVDISVWYGILVPAQTPDEVVSLLSKAIFETFQTEEVRDRYAFLGAVITLKGPQEFKDFIGAEISKTRDAVIAAGLQGSVE
jgi:tripartite-type tricarboxylate transporter receptor subunit TctC